MTYEKNELTRESLKPYFEKRRTLGERFQKKLANFFYSLAVASGIGVFGSLFYGSVYNGMIKPSIFQEYHLEAITYAKNQREIRGIDSFLEGPNPNGNARGIFYLEDCFEKSVGYSRESRRPKLSAQKQKLEKIQTELKILYPSVQDDVKTLDDMSRKESIGLIGAPIGLVLAALFGFAGETIDPDEIKRYGRMVQKWKKQNEN